MSKNTTKGIQLSLVTAFISGFSIFINKFAVGSITPPLVFTTVKNLGVGLFIISFLLLSGRWKLIKKLNKKEILNLLLIGIFGGSVPFYLFFAGLSRIPAINAALIHKTLVFWVALLALPTLKEKLTKTQILAIMLLFSSNLIVGGFKGFEYSVGELLVLGATILWALENVLAKKTLKTIHPDIVTAARMGLGSIILLIASVILAPEGLTQAAKLDNSQLFWIVITMISLLGYVASWYRALKLAPVTTVATVLVSSTLVTNILSAIFITHVFNSTLVIQTALVTTGIWFFIKTSKEAGPSATKALN
ncbi:DMT family transporter [Candidatus Woesebacteria bacterium]|nr:DMT family transporter [Candidatus Woesebacteria bacterium]